MTSAIILNGFSASAAAKSPTTTTGSGMRMILVGYSGNSSPGPVAVFLGGFANSATLNFESKPLVAKSVRAHFLFAWSKPNDGPRQTSTHGPQVGVSSTGRICGRLRPVPPHPKPGGPRPQKLYT